MRCCLASHRASVGCPAGTARPQTEQRSPADGDVERSLAAMISVALASALARATVAELRKRHVELPDELRDL